MADRGAMRRSVSDVLGERKLIWCGLRGEDARTLADLGQFTAAYSVIAPYRGASVEACALEDDDLMGVRPDLETWNVEDHQDEVSVKSFRRRILRGLAGDTVLLPYRSSSFISSITFSRGQRCRDLGRFGGLQIAFEHKPWVETSLAAEGVPTLGWRYLVDPDQAGGLSFRNGSTVVVRPSQTSGGNGFAMCAPSEVAEHWSTGTDGLLSVAPFVDGGLPVNVGAVVWADGVTLHHPSVQLIGIPECVGRPFGYAGSDFGRAKTIPAATLDRIEDIVVRVGTWLGGYGYRGAYGVDLLVTDEQVVFVEVNPRFQGSTALSCAMDSAAGSSCLLIEHVAAALGLEAPASTPLREIAATQPARSVIAIHHTGIGDVAVDLDRIRQAAVTAQVEATTLPDRGTTLAEGALIARLNVDASVTDDGFHLRNPWATMAGAVQGAVLATVADRRTEIGGWR